METTQEANEVPKAGQKVYDHLTDQFWTIESIDGDEVTIINSAGYRAKENIKKVPYLKLVNSTVQYEIHEDAPIKTKTPPNKKVEYLLYLTLYTLIIFVVLVAWIVIFTNIFKDTTTGISIVDAFLQTVFTWAFPFGMAITLWKKIENKVRIRIFNSK